MLEEFFKDPFSQNHTLKVIMKESLKFLELYPSAQSFQKTECYATAAIWAWANGDTFI